MHRRNRVGLRDNERRLLPGHAPRLTAQDRRPRPRSALARAEQSKSRASNRQELVRRRASHEPVLAKTEEREVVVAEPGKGRARFAGLGPADAGQPGSDAAREFECFVGHGLPVAYGELHVGEHGQDARANVGEPGRVHAAIDLDVLPGLRPRRRSDHRSTSRVDRRDRAGRAAPGAPSCAARVRSRSAPWPASRRERHVVRDDLDDSVRRDPPLLGLGVDFDHYDVKSPIIAGLTIGLLSDDPTRRIFRLCNARIVSLARSDSPVRLRAKSAWLLPFRALTFWGSCPNNAS